MIKQLSRNAILLQIEVYFINHDAASFIAPCPDCQIVTVLFIPLCLIIIMPHHFTLPNLLSVKRAPLINLCISA